MEVIDVSLIINLISDNGLFPNLSNKVLLQQIKNNLKGLIEYYIKSNETMDNQNIKAYYKLYDSLDKYLFQRIISKNLII